MEDKGEEGLERRIEKCDAHLKFMLIVDMVVALISIFCLLYGATSRSLFLVLVGLIGIVFSLGKISHTRIERRILGIIKSRLLG